MLPGASQEEWEPRGIPLQKQDLQELVEAEAISHRLLQGGRPLRRAFGEQFFGDVVRGQKGTEL